MPRRKKKDVEIDDYRHGDKRSNDHEAGQSGVLLTIDETSRRAV